MSIWFDASIPERLKAPFLDFKGLRTVAEIDQPRKNPIGVDSRSKPR